MSETTNIKLFKHDDVSTNTDTFDVDKALNENWDKLDEAIGTNTNNIEALQTDNTTNKSDISEIKQEQTIQNKNIQNNADNITQQNSKQHTTKLKNYTVIKT